MCISYSISRCEYSTLFLRTALSSKHRYYASFHYLPHPLMCSPFYLIMFGGNHHALYKPDFTVGTRVTLAAKEETLVATGLALFLDAPTEAAPTSRLLALGSGWMSQSGKNRSACHHQLRCRAQCLRLMAMATYQGKPTVERIEGVRRLEA